MAIPFSSVCSKTQNINEGLLPKALLAKQAWHTRCDPLGPCGSIFTTVFLFIVHQEA